MPTDSTTRLKIGALLMIVAIFGCRKEAELGKVSGQVTLNGQPVQNVVVVFENRDAGVFMQAPVDAAGKYEVSTAAGYGLPLGTYKIAVQPYKPVQADAGPNPFQQDVKSPTAPWMAKWRDANRTGKTFTVAPGANTFDVPLD